MDGQNPSLTLMQATVENKIFQKLEKQWKKDILKYEDENTQYSMPYLEHAKRIISENLNGYGIYVLVDERSHIHGLLHANLARLPKTTGTTLRILWVLLAPRYDYEDLTQPDYAAVTSSILYGALKLARGEMQADHVKVHLQNVGDKRFAQGVAYTLSMSDAGSDVAVRGNWLHMNNVSAQKRENSVS